MWSTYPLITEDQDALLDLDEEEGWAVLIEDLQYFKKKVPGLTPFQAYTWHLTQKKKLGKYQELFYPRGFLLMEAIRLRHPELVKYYVSQGAPLSADILKEVFVAGPEYIKYITPALRRNSARFRTLESFPKDPVVVKAILDALNSVGDVASIQYLLQRASPMTLDKIQLKPIWLREVKRETPEPLILAPVVDPVPPDLAKLQAKGEVSDPKALMYLVETGSSLWREIVDKNTSVKFRHFM